MLHRVEQECQPRLLDTKVDALGSSAVLSQATCLMGTCLGATLEIGYNTLVACPQVSYERDNISESDYILSLGTPLYFIQRTPLNFLP